MELAHAPTVEVHIEIPRGSFLKRGSDGHVDFVSPIPCPFNYGSVREYIGGEGDFLDAVVLGQRLPVGHRMTIKAYGSVGMSERFMYDDKLICSNKPITAAERRGVILFFRLYALCKGLYNFSRGQRGRARCEGWGRADSAIDRAVPVEQKLQEPTIEF